MDTVVFRETTVHFYSCMCYKVMHTGRMPTLVIPSSAPFVIQLSYLQVRSTMYRLKTFIHSIRHKLDLMEVVQSSFYDKYEDAVFGKLGLVIENLMTDVQAVLLAG